MAAKATNVQPGPTPSAPTTRAGRARLRTISDVDGRTAAGRRLRDIADSYVSDLGGADALTAQEKALIARATTLQSWCEAAEAAYADTGVLDVAAYSTCTNTLRRVLADLGLERRARDVTPTISEYIARRAAEKGAQRADGEAA